MHHYHCPERHPRWHGNRLQKEELLNRPYTGKGTMIGIFDDGIDPNHAMFLDKDDVSRFRIFSTSKTKMTDVPSKIAAYKTDNRYSSHATHVSCHNLPNLPASQPWQNTARNTICALSPICRMVQPTDLMMAATFLPKPWKSSSTNTLSSHAFPQETTPTNPLWRNILSPGKKLMN